jgi:hypothetical protein
MENKNYTEGEGKKDPGAGILVEGGNVIFKGFFLEEGVKKFLFEKFPSVHEKKIGSHATTQFVMDETKRHHTQVNLGNKARFAAVAEVSDSKGQALLIKQISGDNADFITTQYPHITLSCAEGVSPIYSNELFKKAFSEGFPESYTAGEYIVESPEGSIVIKVLEKDEVVIPVTEGYFDGDLGKVITNIEDIQNTTMQKSE